MSGAAMPKRTVSEMKAEVEWVTFKGVNDKANALKDTSKTFESMVEDANFFDMLRSDKEGAESEDDARSSTSSSSVTTEEEIILHRSADVMESKLRKAFLCLESFQKEMEKVKTIMVKKYNKTPDFEKSPEVIRLKTCEEIQNDLFKLVREVTGTEDMDDDEWQDIDDDEDGDDRNDMVDDLQKVVYGFHRLFTAFTELDMSKQMRLNEEQYAQAAKMLIRCLPSKEMKERYGQLAQTYEDYTLALFDDLESRREDRPEEELVFEGENEDEIERKRRQADRERKMLNFISSLKYLKGEFDDDDNMAHMVDVQMQDAQMLYAEMQETKRKEG